jgi:hypothetical protein
MYRRAKFVEILLEIRQEMAHEADYDVDLFAELARSGGTDAGPKARKKLTNPRAVKAGGADDDTIRLDKDLISK